MLRRRADKMIGRAIRINVLRMGDRSHDEARVQMGLPIEAYRRARRWLRIAVDRCLASDDWMDIADALREYGGEVVANALWIGAHERKGQSHVEMREVLELTEDEWEEALAWWRDASALIAED